jgi:hypothetical protein
MVQACPEGLLLRSRPSAEQSCPKQSGHERCPLGNQTRSCSMKLQMETVMRLLPCCVHQ